MSVIFNNPCGLFEVASREGHGRDGGVEHGHGGVDVDGRLHEALAANGSDVAPVGSV